MFKNFLALVLFVVLSVAIGFIACSSEADEPDRECITDNDCFHGFRCIYQKCKEIVTADGDQDLVEIEKDLDIDEPEIEQEPEPDVDGDLEESFDGDVVCTMDSLDPKCGNLFVQSYCRDNTVKHSVKVCRSDNSITRLFNCIQIEDCSYPNCGYVVNYSNPRTCTDGCISNPDPEKDDYCFEDGPPVDGDMDDDLLDAIDIEEAEIEEALVNQPDGKICYSDANCRPSHKCRPDIDASAKYCVRDSATCAYHLGLSEDQDALQFAHGDRLCTVSNSYKYCSSGLWLGEVVCQVYECIGSWFIDPTFCENGLDGKSATCVSDPPVPNPPHQGQCPGNYSCDEDETHCLETCTTFEECRSGYTCTQHTNLCVEM